MLHQRFINGTIILGIAILLLGFGFYLTIYWQKAIMFIASLVFILLSYRAFTDDE